MQSARVQHLEPADARGRDGGVREELARATMRQELAAR
jgi:hypothetical protein